MFNLCQFLVKEMMKIKNTPLHRMQEISLSGHILPLKLASPSHFDLLQITLYSHTVDVKSPWTVRGIKFPFLSPSLLLKNVT